MVYNKDERQFTKCWELPKTQLRQILHGYPTPGKLYSLLQRILKPWKTFSKFCPSLVLTQLWLSQLPEVLKKGILSDIVKDVWIINYWNSWTNLKTQSRLWKRYRQWSILVSPQTFSKCSFHLVDTLILWSGAGQTVYIVPAQFFGARYVKDAKYRVGDWTSVKNKILYATAYLSFRASTLSLWKARQQNM